MKKLKNYVIEYWKEDYHPGYYATVALFLVVSLFLNYYFNIGYKLYYMAMRERNPLTLIYNLFFYGVPYLFTMSAYGYFKKDWSWVYKKEFWLRFGLVLLVMDLVLGTWFHRPFAKSLFDNNPDRYFAMLWFMSFKMHLFTLVPVGLFYYFKDRELPFLYGLRFKGFDAKPYWIVAAIVIPTIFLVSFSPHFTGYYPICKPSEMKFVRFISPVNATILYEITYAGMYVWVEVLFRGFLVVGMSKVLGKNSILPMAAMYCFIHFAKPAGEATTAIIGGYILGILAYRTENIMGGVVLHITVAMGMEFFAMWQLMG